MIPAWLPSLVPATTRRSESFSGGRRTVRAPGRFKGKPASSRGSATSCSRTRSSCSPGRPSTRTARERRAEPWCAVLALTSALLAAAFALLGSRYAKYDRLQWDVAAEAERRLPEHLTLIDRIHTLRQNAAAEGPTGERYELSAAERLVSISRLLVWAPAALCVTSLVLFVMSFLPR
jgi:hypothetical protein